MKHELIVRCLMMSSLILMCGCHSSRAGQNEVGIRLTIATPDMHFYNISSDAQALGATGMNFHDILLTKEQMATILALVSQKHRFAWQTMMAQNSYPRNHTVLLLYGSQQESLQCTIGEPRTAVPILEELNSFLPEEYRSMIRETTKRIKNAQQGDGD